MTTTTALPTGTWTLDPSTTDVSVTVKKMKVMTVPATLTVTSGNVTIADGQVTSVEVVTDATSYASPNKKRNEHVASADFLDSASHPTITFAATDATPGSGATQQVSGQVTIKGHTAPITFAVTDVSIDDDTATFTATASADRFDLGVDKMPSFVIAKQLDIKVTATARRQA